MKILNKDLAQGIVQIHINCLEDLWYLYALIKPNDLIKMTTWRYKDVESDKLRPENKIKRKITLKLKITNIKFQEFSNRLRTQGIIIDGENLGSYHTFDISVGSKFQIEKYIWEAYEVKYLEDAVNITKEDTLIIVALDYNEATIARIHTYGVEFIANIYSYSSGKIYPSNEKKISYYEKIYQKLAYTKDKIVVAGPGFAKDDFVNHYKEKLPLICVVSATSSTIAGINEVLKSNVVENLRLSKEIRLVETIFHEIAKDGLVAYGKKEVQYGLSLGAVDKLVFTEKFMRYDNDTKNLVELARKTNAKYMIICSFHEGGRKLNTLGGVAALLRYKVK